MEDKCNTIERRQTLDGCIKVVEHGHRSMEKGFWIRPGQVPQLTREVIRAMPERIFFAGVRPQLGVNDTQIDSIQYLNFAKK